MDNPNDFIHIDEVFRKLKDREEPEGTGSWMRMKELLDKEMPVGSPASPFKTLRRYMLPMVATLLIGSGLAYYGITRYDGKDLLPENRPAVTASHNTDTKSSGMPFEKENTKGNMAVADAGGESHNPSAAGKTLPKDGFAEGAGNGGDSKHIARSYTSNGRAVSKVTPGNVTPKIGDHLNTSDKTSIAGTENNVQHKARATGEKLPAGKPGAIAANGKNQPIVAPPAKPFEKQNVLETIYPVTGGNKANNDKPAYGAENNNAGMKIVAANSGKEKIVKDESGSLFKEVRDTIRKIDLVQRMETGNNRSNKTPEVVTDTLAITRVERIRYTPLEPMEIVALRKANIIPKAEVIVPMARLKTTVTVTNEMVNMVPLSDYKVASRKVDPSKFNQLVQNTSQGISNYFDGTNKFYAAILLGGNGFMGNPTAFGMQFGIAGLYQLSERLTLAGELKFANHYFSNYTINDQSVTYENVSGQQSGIEWLFNGMQHTTTSAYKINSFSALEFPVTLSYSLGRVAVFGGLNMAYAFPVKWDKSNSINTTAVSQSTTQNRNPFLNSDFKLNEQKDFASRFGMGYVGGLTYDVSRKLSFDARVTQNLWTDYNGSADAVNKLFKMPTFQFSIGYFFGRKERVMYILDK